SNFNERKIGGDSKSRRPGQAKREPGPTTPDVCVAKSWGHSRSQPPAFVVIGPDLRLAFAGTTRELGLIPRRRKQVSAAADGADHRRLGRVGLDLAPDPHDPQIDG